MHYERRFEHLIRYVARPPLAEERLSILPDGRVAYALKRRWRDGTTAVVLDPLTFLERLAALVPRPRKKQVNYYGVFASAASYRHRVVPVPVPPQSEGDAMTTPDRSHGSEHDVSCRHVPAIPDVPAAPAPSPRPDSLLPAELKPRPSSPPRPTCAEEAPPAAAVLLLG